MLPIVAASMLYPEIIIRSSVSITSNLIASISYLSTISRNDFELQKLLDIVEDITIIKTFVEEKESTTNSKTIGMCIKSLNDPLMKLEHVIDSITKKIHSHKDKWFNSIRSYDIAKEKEQIPVLVNQMKHRFEMLIKVSSTLR